MIENGADFEFLDFGEMSEVEARISDARDYVRVSDDLRPRVLEAGRSRWMDMRMRGFIEWASVVAIAIAMVVPFRPPSNAALASDFGFHVGLTAEMSDAAFGPGPDKANWMLVDAFTEFRRRQSETLRLTPTTTTPTTTMPAATMPAATMPVKASAGPNAFL